MAKRDDRERVIKESLESLSQYQVDLLASQVEQLVKAYILIERLEGSDFVTECVLESFGDTLRIHHSSSIEALSKDRFEFGLRGSLISCEIDAELAPRGNPGHDMDVAGIRISLKTQANRDIKVNRIWISKFMELGRGEWTDSVDDLVGLRDQFFEHMKAYERIFILRCLSRRPSKWHYELVEIPLELLRTASSGKLRIMDDSPQSPKPGYCDVVDADGEPAFQLYFDGGTERKLQIKNLHKRNCIVHAQWTFSTEEESDSQGVLEL